MLREIFYPSTELEKMISHYIVIDFENTMAGIPCTLPKGACAMVFVYSAGKPSFSFLDSPETYSGNSFVSGYTMKVVKLNFVGRIKCIIAFFTPMGAWRLFKIPPGEYLNQFISAENFIGSKANLLTEQFQSFNSTWQVAHHLDSFLKMQIPDRQLISEICDFSTGYIQENKGVLRIDELMHHAHFSSRNIDRHFEKYLGMTPKQYAWLTRLNQVFMLMMNNKNIPIHEVIDILGYFDQAHLINDIKKYTGSTPRIFKEHLMTSIISSYTDPI
jgi:AraC-like DNA-binding protein